MQLSLPRSLSEPRNTEKGIWAEKFWVTALRLSLSLDLASFLVSFSSTSFLQKRLLFYTCTDSRRILCYVLSTTFHYQLPTCPKLLLHKQWQYSDLSNQSANHKFNMNKSQNLIKILFIFFFLLSIKTFIVCLCFHILELKVPKHSILNLCL